LRIAGDALRYRSARCDWRRLENQIDATVPASGTHWLSNTLFESYDAIVDAACKAWNKLIAQPQTITSIGLRTWAHVGQPL